MAWYALQLFIFMVLANVLVWVTFHDIEPGNPSYPGKVLGSNSTYAYGPVFDLGFYVTPDWSHRPWYIKFLFVDLTVNIAQAVPPLVLIIGGFTKRFVSYTGIVGIINICKGIVQLITILPPANDGDECWVQNFSEAQLATVKDAPFYTWFFQTWGTAHGCNDMIWSGHTANSTVGFLFVNICLRDMGVGVWWRSLIIVYFAIYVCAVSAMRMHYTVDVIVAFIVAAALFTHQEFRNVLWSWVNKMVRNLPDDAVVPSAPPQITVPEESKKEESKALLSCC